MLNKFKQGTLRGLPIWDGKLTKIPGMTSGGDKSGSTAVGALISNKYVTIVN